MGFLLLLHPNESAEAKVSSQRKLQDVASQNGIRYHHHYLCFFMCRFEMSWFDRDTISGPLLWLGQVARADRSWHGPAMSIKSLRCCIPIRCDEMFRDDIALHPV